MNEFVEPDSAARLVGTFHDPEGLLTSAVRREPFCVVLLDEIEKAHPAVFDLLLAVLGEGRLTDARGRTADFTNAVVIMTSNLGVREAANTFGLRPGGEGTDDAATYLAAAERFFRPEFFNRIDRVIPFARLTREEVGRIATLLMEDVFRREGLVHRRSILTVDPAAMAKVVDAGYHPQLGARALKRAIERQLTQPVAARLATMTPGTPAVIGLYPSRDGIAVHVDALDQVATAAAPSARLPMDDPDLVLDCVEDAAVRIEESAAALDPGRGAALTQGALSADHFRYLAVRDQARRVATLVERVDAALDRKASSSKAQRTHYTPGRAPRYKRLTRYDSVGKYLWRHLLSQESLHSHLSDVVGAEVEADHAPGGNEEIADRLCELVGEVALLEAMAAGGADRVLVCVRFLAGIQSVEAAMLQSSYENMFRARYGVSATWLHRQHLGDDLVAPGVAWMLLEMPAAERVLAGEVGTHLFVPAHENVMPAQVSVVPLSEGQDPPSAVREFLGRRERFRAEMVAGRASPADDPWRLGPVVRVYDPAATVDLRTGLASKGWPEAHEFRRFVLAQLPLPAELTEVLSPLPPREG